MNESGCVYPVLQECRQQTFPVDNSGHTLSVKYRPSKQRFTGRRVQFLCDLPDPLYKNFILNRLKSVGYTLQQGEPLPEEDRLWIGKILLTIYENSLLRQDWWDIRIPLDLAAGKGRPQQVAARNFYLALRVGFERLQPGQSVDRASENIASKFDLDAETVIRAWKRHSKVCTSIIAALLKTDKEAGYKDVHAIKDYLLDLDIRIRFAPRQKSPARKS